jgi:hypothetical protein
MMENVVTFGSEKNLIGILSKGSVDRSGPRRPAVIMLNAGLVHRVGPNRVYVELSRLLSQIGLDVLRFDFSGVGDSCYRKDNFPVSKSGSQEVGMAMDFLVRERIAKEFVLIGICSGAGFAFLSAYEDQRVVGAVLVNVQPPDTQIGQELKTSSFYLKSAVSSTSSWIKFLVGKSNYQEVWKSIVIRIRMALFRKSVIRSESEDVVNWLKTAFHSYLARSLRLLMISSGNEVGANYIRRIIRDEVQAMENADLVQFIYIPEADHTFTLRNSQNRLFTEISKWFAELYGI